MKYKFIEQQHTQDTTGGFTLVETLIAIAILMIAIAGPLTIANQSLNAALGSRNVMIATNLAQDGMESIKNIKDNAIATHTSWQDAIGAGTTNTLCSLGTNPCQTPDIPNGGSFGQCGANLVSCKLYIQSDGMYTYTGGSNETTPFTRTFYVTDGLSSDKIVTVVVDWTQGSIKNEIRLQDLMTGAER